MTNIEINGAEYVPIDSIELEGNAEDVQERLSRAVDELNTKQAQRQAVENERELTAHVYKYYGKELKDVEAFIKLCRVKRLSVEQNNKEILTLFKSLPKSAKKSTLSRFLRL